MADSPQNPIIPSWLPSLFCDVSPGYESELYGPITMGRVRLLSTDERVGEQPVKVPFFTVFKAAASPEDDRLLTFVEVKPANMTLTAAKERLGKYFEALRHKRMFDSRNPPLDHLQGLLVVGKKAHLVSLSAPGGLVQCSPPLDILGNEVHDFLMSVVTQNSELTMN